MEELKRAAGLKALDLVRSGMTVGLGTGSTAKWFVEGLGAKLAAGELSDVTGVPTSTATREQAERLGIPLVALPADGLDLAVDGMDELAPGLDATKGLGGALTREKVVAASAKRFVLIGDETKLVDRLGRRAPVPVETIEFGHERTSALLAALGCQATLRVAAGAPVRTDNGNLVYDCHFAEAFEPAALAVALAGLPGVVEHGLFLGMAERAFVASSGGVLELDRGWRG